MEIEVKNDDTILLTCADGVELHVPKQYAFKCKTIENMLDGFMVVDGEEPSLPLPNIKSDTLERIMTYCAHHFNDPPPQPPTIIMPEKVVTEETKDGEEESASVEEKPSPPEDTKDQIDLVELQAKLAPISEWDQEFLRIDKVPLFELVLAANFLEYKALLDVCCKTIANNLKKCKDPEDIRKYLNIKNDFTPAEEAAVRKEHEWALEQPDEPTPAVTEVSTQ